MLNKKMQGLKQKLKLLIESSKPKTVLFHFDMPFETGKVQIIERIVVQKAEKKRENVETQSSITN